MSGYWSQSDRVDKKLLHQRKTTRITEWTGFRLPSSICWNTLRVSAEPVLFIIYISNLEKGLISTLSKFADHTKVGGKNLTTDDCEIIHKSFDQIILLSEKWVMSFHADKWSHAQWLQKQ